MTAERDGGRMPTTEEMDRWWAEGEAIGERVRRDLADAEETIVTFPPVPPADPRGVLPPGSPIVSVAAPDGLVVVDDDAEEETTP